MMYEHMNSTISHYQHLLSLLDDLQPEQAYYEDHGWIKFRRRDHYSRWKRFIRSAGKSITVVSLTHMTRRKLNSCVHELHKDPKAFQRSKELISTMTALLGQLESWADTRAGEVTAEIRRLRSDLQRLRPRGVDPTGMYYSLESIADAVVTQGQFSGEIWLALARLGASGYTHFREAEQEYHSLLRDDIQRRLVTETEKANKPTGSDVI